MSSAPAPTQETVVFNAIDYPFSGVSIAQGGDKLNFPIGQGNEAFPNGITHGDGTYQVSAYTGAGALAGTYTSANLTIDINGRVTAISNGSGGGGGVNNPMTSDLDGGGFDITNVGSYTGMDITVAEVNTEEVNNSAAVIYRDKGPVVAGNYYAVGEGLIMTDAEASCILVSRCLDPGFRQTIVAHVSMFNAKAHINLISNAVESDTPIFTIISCGDDGLASGGFSLFCNQNSSTWEYRVYRQQDDKGTGAYPANSFFTFAVGGAVAIPPWTVEYASIDTSVHASAAVSASFLAKTSLTSASLLTDTAVANVSLSTPSLTVGSVSAQSGPAGISFQDFIQFPSQDSILNAGEVEVTNISPSVALGIIGVGAVGNRTMFVDTNNRRVGINVATPQEDFEIDGNIQLDSAGANKIKFYDGTASVERAEIDAATSGATGGKLVFYTKQDPGVITARMTIEEDGRIQVTNRIENMPDPVAAQDAATKAYVDAQVVAPGFVQNPMVSTLDAGQFGINNLSFLSVDNTTSGGPNSVSINLVGSGSVFEAYAASLIKFGGSTIFTDPLRISGLTDEVEIGKFNDGATTTTCVSVEHNASRAITTFNEAQYFNHNDPDAHETFAYTFFRDVVTTNTTSLRQDGPDLRFAPNNINGQVEMPEIKLPYTSNSATYRNDGVVRTDKVTVDYPFVSVDGPISGTNVQVDVGGQCTGPLCGFQAIGGGGDYALPYTIGSTGWNDTNDQDIILMFPLECPFRNQGIPVGTLNYYARTEYPANIFFTGFRMTTMVQWLPGPGATVDLVFGSTGSLVVVEANILTAPGRFNFIVQWPKSQWIDGSSIVENFYLRLNIPLGSQIDAQEALNRGCIQFVPFYRSYLEIT